MATSTIHLNLQLQTKKSILFSLKIIFLFRQNPPKSVSSQVYWDSCATCFVRLICPLRVDWRAATQFSQFLVVDEHYSYKKNIAKKLGKYAVRIFSLCCIHDFLDIHIPEMSGQLSPWAQSLALSSAT